MHNLNPFGFSGFPTNSEFCPLNDCDNLLYKLLFAIKIIPDTKVCYLMETQMVYSVTGLVIFEYKK